MYARRPSSIATPVRAEAVCAYLLSYWAIGSFPSTLGEPLVRTSRLWRRGPSLARTGTIKATLKMGNVARVGKSQARAYGDRSSLHVAALRAAPISGLVCSQIGDCGRFEDAPGAKSAEGGDQHRCQSHGFQRCPQREGKFELHRLGNRQPGRYRADQE